LSSSKSDLNSEVNVFFKGNSEKLRLIDSALFALALDDTGPEDVTQISKSFLHSDGVNR